MRLYPHKLPVPLSQARADAICPPSLRPFETAAAILAAWDNGTSTRELAVAFRLPLVCIRSTLKGAGRKGYSQ